MAEENLQHDWRKRMQSHQLSRRAVTKMAFGVAGSAALASLLAACGGEDDEEEPAVDQNAATATTGDTSSPSATTAATPAETSQGAQATVPSGSAEPEPKRGGTLVSMVVAEPTSMDIAAGTGQHNYAIMSNVFENLLFWDDTSFDIKPGLAESYEVSEDGLTYTFKLREGVMFHDGTELDAEAVKFSYSRVLDPDDEFYKIGQPFPLMDFWYGAIDPKQTEIHDKYSVSLKLKQPFSPLASYLAWPAAAIVSPQAVRTHREAFRENPVGTGPFKFESWEHNQQVTFVRFEDYWGEPAYLDSLIFRPIVEEQTRVTELLSGNIHFGYDLPPDNIKQVEGDSNLRFHQTPLGHVWFLVLNTKSGPTADVKVRQAIAHAIDKQAIIEDILQGWAVEATGPVPAAIEYAYNKDVQTYPYDPEKAKQLLSEAGFPDGFKSTFWVTQSGSGMQSPKAMGEAIQAMLGQVGIQLQLEVFEWGAYLDKYAQGLPENVSVGQMSWFANDAQNIANLTVTCRTVSPKGYNAGYYCNERVDELLDAFYGTLDAQKQATLIHELQDIIAEDVPNVYIDSQIATAALSKQFTGFSLHPSQLLRFGKTGLA